MGEDRAVMVQAKAGRRPHVLLITKNDFRPERDGGSKRTAALQRELVEAGFDVSAVAVRPFVVIGVEGHQASSIPGLPAIVRVLASTISTMSLSAMKWFSPRAVCAIEATQHVRPADVVIIDHPQLFAYRSVVRGPVMMSLHNVESGLLASYAKSARGWLRRAVAKFEARRMRAIERHLPARFDVITLVSEHDAREFASLVGRRLEPSRLVVAPNGVGEEFFEIEGPRGSGAVFVAHLGWRPNIDGARWLVEQVWPARRSLGDGALLRLVGRQPSDEVSRLVAPDVTVHPDVESVLPYLREAAVATAPLQAAGGTRIKILEAMAAGVPVVATSLGALGLEHLDGRGMSIEDEPRAFAAALHRVATESPGRAEIRAGVESYRWRQSLQPIVDAVSKMSRA